MTSTTPHFSGGRNIAMKVPPHLHEATIRFYRDVLGLTVLVEHAPSAVFEFGGNSLWVDCGPGISQAEIWLEIVTPDTAAAAAHLEAAEVVRCDAIEPLPRGSHAFWVSSPASIVHLVCRKELCDAPAANESEATP